MSLLSVFCGSYLISSDLKSLSTWLLHKKNVLSLSFDVTSAEMLLFGQTLGITCDAPAGTLHCLGWGTLRAGTCKVKIQNGLYSNCQEGH